MKSDTYYGIIDVLAKVMGIALCIGLFFGIMAIMRSCSAVTVNTAIEPENSGTIEKTGDYSNYLNAVPNDGYEFDHWGGDIDCALSKIYLRKEESKSTYNVTAYFKRIDAPPVCRVGNKDLVIRTIALDIKQVYSNTPDGFSLPFHDDIKAWLKMIGIMVVDPDKTHDAVISLDIEGEALGDYYGDWLSNRYYYTGASASGVISLKVNGKVIHKQQIERIKEPPDKITIRVGSERYETPIDLFEEIGIYGDIRDFMNAVWGPAIYIKMCYNADYLTSLGEEAVPILIDALSDPDIDVRRYSIGILNELGPKAKAAIPALMKVLEDDDYKYAQGFDLYNPETGKMDSVDADVYFQSLAQDALKAITGESIKANP